MQEDLEIHVPGYGEVAVAEYGDPSGRPILFLHGWPSSRIQGRLCDADGRRLGLRIVAFDRPGIGGSEGCGVEGLADWPGFVEALVGALGIAGKVSILAVSGGAPFVYACGWGLAERLELAAVVCGAVPLAYVRDRRAVMLPYRVLMWARESVPWALAGIMQAAGLLTGLKVTHPVAWAMLRFLPVTDREVMAEPLVHDCVMGSFREALRGGVDGILGEAAVFVDEWPFGLEEVRFPIRFWHGELDNNIPATLVREVVGQLPDAEVKWYPDEGHYSIAAGRIGEVLEWMASEGVRARSGT
ncbi:MAG: alpha/beta hydrolase [Verrucomicrobiales bacterium]|nr:alpha/beta hydrolase [Verrucomicrobiales bacterium]